MGDTIISWTNKSWNPVHGCSHISEGCRNCYAEAISLRFGWTKLPWTAANAKENVKLMPHLLDDPRHWRKPCMVFVNSMGDIFHELVSDDYLAKIFAVMSETPRHTYQALTKHGVAGPQEIKRAVAWPGPWTENIWQGCSVATQKDVDTCLPLFVNCRAKVSFVSAEPLVEPLNLAPYLHHIAWVIAGGESGPNFRPMQMAWARSIRDQCVAAGVAFFFKQDAARITETRPWIVEPDGSRWEWHQWPGALTPPTRVQRNK